MRSRVTVLLFIALAIALGIAVEGQTGAQGGGNTVDTHLAAAKTAAGSQWGWMYDRLCGQALGDFKKAPRPGPANPPARAGGPPPQRSQWHAEPVKVFDNLYRVGSIEHSAWAIKTSDGIILMDAIFDYNVQDEVVDGLKKLGLESDLHQVRDYWSRARRPRRWSETIAG